MKTLHTILDKGNLTPKERFVLLVQNDIHKMKTGKEILTEADKAALEQWKAQTNEEAREWNRLREGWMHTGRMEIEAEFHFNDAQSAHFQVKPIIMELLRYPLNREIGRMIENLKNIKKVGAVQAMEIVQKQRTVKLWEGMDFEYAVYRLAFERLSAADRERFFELYQDIKTDHQYLDQEEIIAHLLEGKEELSDAAKERLAELIAERAYNKFAKEYQLFHYFACIPLAEVARHFLESKGVAIGGKPLAKNQETDDADTHTHQEIQKAVEEYAREHRMTVEAILKQGFMDWYDAEEFEYTPLVVSDDKALFERWLKTRADARAELERLIGEGALQVRGRSPQETQKDKLYSRGLLDSELYGAKKGLEMLDAPRFDDELDEKKAFEKFSHRVITGDSLYAFPSDLEFIRDFKERADEYDPNLGLVYADDDPKHEGQHLDQELLICSLTGKGEPTFFSMYHLTLMRLEMSLQSVAFFKEEEKDGKTVIKFKNKEIEKMFKESREAFIEAYGKLLGMHEVLKKLSETYETEVAFRTGMLLARLNGFIHGHNEALDTAQRAVRYKIDKDKPEKVIATMDKGLYIDKDAIQPDATVIEEHTEKLRKLIGSF